MLDLSFPSCLWSSWRLLLHLQQDVSPEVSKFPKLTIPSLMHSICCCELQRQVLTSQGSGQDPPGKALTPDREQKGCGGAEGGRSCQMKGLYSMVLTGVFKAS